MADPADPPRAAGARPSSDRQRPDASEPTVQYLVHSEGVAVDTAIEMIYVQGHASTVAAAARVILGDRFGEVRIEPDGHILVTVIDLTDADDAAVQDVARRCGIDGWVRTRRADPAALLAWEQLRPELQRLQDTRPGVLVTWPSPDADYRQPPFSITLSARGVDVAAALYDRFGVYVELYVGALPYPLERDRLRLPRLEPPSTVVDPAEIHIELDGPLTIASGQTAHHGLLLTNFGDTIIRVKTNGHLTARIADPASGKAIGGYVGVQRMPLKPFSAAPGDTVQIPLLVGTASFDPKLGYAIPPGEWALYATLNLTDGRTLDTPLLPLTIRD